MKNEASTYTGLFLIALSSLAIQIVLVRLLSVITWYFLAFFAISTAMLGMTVGAIQVYVEKDRFGGENKTDAIARACLKFALSIPASLILLCVLPIGFYKSILSLIVLIATTWICASPFYYSGLVITAVLTRFNAPIGRLYASDLTGASAGCLIVLGGLELVDAPSLMLWCSGIGALAGACFARLPQSARRYTALAFLLFLLGILNAQTRHGIRPMFIKETFQVLDDQILERWNSFSQVVVYRQAERPTPLPLWGPSPVTTKENIVLHAIKIDGAAYTKIFRHASPKDIEHLRYDVTNIGYYLNRQGKTCIIGVGGGKDILSALAFGHNAVLGIEVNPIFVELLQNEFREFAGLADYEGVTLIVDDARSFLAQSREQFSVIQMALTDTWATTGAGAFSLSENALYTVEAWQTFLRRLSPDGIFTVSRWYSPQHIGETGRVLSLGVASLLHLDVTTPADHMALIATGNIATLIICRNPLSATDIDHLKRVCADLQYQIVHLPGNLPAAPVLKQIVSAQSADQLADAVAHAKLNYAPPTDDNPYFFNMLKLNHLSAALKVQEGVIRGNLRATAVLLALLIVLGIVAGATIGVPLWLTHKPNARLPPGFWFAALYFSLIGAAFMLVEIASIQRLNVFLGHPIYSLGISLFTLIASTGLGSFASDYLPLTRKPWTYIFPITTALSIVALNAILHLLLTHMISESTETKILLSILVIFPTGMLMGLFFPMGMRLVQTNYESETPWFWALNGIMSVLCSALTVFFSIFIGISTNFYLAAVAYALALWCIYNLQRSDYET